MIYTVKSGDSLGKIAKKFSVQVATLLALNPAIINPDHIAAGQVINVPNMQDIPSNVEFETPVEPSALVSRARSVVNSKILYQLGSGGMFPDDPLPSRNGLCDCSGFICWVLGLSRQTKIPFYKKHGGWIYTDAMVDDINSSSGIFERLLYPEPGCIVVYGAGKKIGHVGLVSETADHTMKRVIHCSSGNSRAFNAAIQETAPTVFNRADSLWGRFVG